MAYKRRRGHNELTVSSEHLCSIEDGVCKIRELASGWNSDRDEVLVNAWVLDSVVESLCLSGSVNSWRILALSGHSHWNWECSKSVSRQSQVFSDLSNRECLAAFIK